ncbi:M10 family metallopeptidase C-terminal domain-containing protein, partial [Vibrio makurazakiensis]|uniref:VWA domain-containing protein n=1 Tax=Vibrio makurazakiensis TaxID=2910250 RepID=UPI003D1140E3
DETYTITIGGDSGTGLIQDNNTAPTVQDGHVIGEEDKSYQFSWADFKVEDLDSNILSIVITSEAAEGDLYFYDGNAWVHLDTATIGSGFTVTQEQITSNKLIFVPVNHGSSSSNEDDMGLTGNNKPDYAEFSYHATDGVNNSGSATMSVDINAIADAPKVTVTLGDLVASNGLSSDIYQNLINTQQLTSEQLSDLVETLNLDDSYKGVQIAHQWEGSGQPGTQDKQDSLYIGTDGTDTHQGGAGNDWFVSGAGNDRIDGDDATNTTVNDGFDTMVYSGSISDYVLTNLGDHGGKVGHWLVTDKRGIDTPNDPYTPADENGDHIYEIDRLIFSDGVLLFKPDGGYEIIQEQTLPLDIQVELNDLDGSEVLDNKVEVSEIPSGLLVFVGDTLMTPINGVYELALNANGAASAEIRVPVDYTGTMDFAIKATAVSHEVSDGKVTDSASGSDSVDVNVRGYSVSTGESGDDQISTGDENNIVIGDVKGLQIVPGEDYNIAFIFDTSGSMHGTISLAKPELQAAFDALVDSAGSDNSGTVNVLLTEFHTNASHVISIDLGGLNPKKDFADALIKITDDSSGMTNYEAGFDSAVDWFAGLQDNGATNHSFFISDGEVNESTKDGNQLGDFWIYHNSATGKTLTIEDVLELPRNPDGDIYIDGNLIIDGKKHHDEVYSPYTNVKLGKVEKDGDVTTFKADNGLSPKVQAQHMYQVLSAMSVVQAIGIGSGVSESTLKDFDSDRVVDAKISVDQLAEAILGQTTLATSGSDIISGGDGADVLFGDLVQFNGNSQGVAALQEYVAAKLNQPLSSIDVKAIHTYISEHASEFDVSRADDKGDVIHGGEGNDVIFGQGGNDKLFGDEGHDQLFGGAGDDELSGGAGHDILIGGAGNDILTGGEGDDIFKWVDEPYANHEDVITDFHVNEDHLDISELLPNENTMVDLLEHIVVEKVTDTDDSGEHTDIVITISDAGNSGDNQTIVLDHTGDQFANLADGQVTGDELTNLMNTLFVHLPDQ